jgi:hypothetical protein
VKGILKSFESVIGVSIIMITFVALYTSSEVVPEIETSNWKYAGLNGLNALDAANELRYDALNNNTGAIENRIDAYIPPNLKYIVQVCGASCEVPNIGATKSTSVHYLISGDANNSTLREINLYMWSDE